MLRTINRILRAKNKSLFNTKNLFSDTAKNSRQQRIAAASAKGTPGAIKSGSIFTGKRVAVGVSIAGIIGASYELSRKDSVLAQFYVGSSLQRLINWIYENTWGSFKEVFLPVSDKLLPDWPTAPCYGNPLPGTPAPPVLVIDLERTLIGSVHDAKHGWRHVKRPGADKFLEALSNYYEIVLFSENDKSMMFEVFEALDKNGSCHKFGSAEGEIRDGITLKRIDVMNRDPGRILFIDDNPEGVKLCPDNALLIKPFTDIYDTKDRALLDLIPLLQAFVHEGVQDFRSTLNALGTHNAEEAVHEYELRLAKRKMLDDQKKNAGIGGIIRTSLGNSATSSFASATNKTSGAAATSQGLESHDTEDDEKVSKASAASGVGATPPPPPATKKKGKLFQMLDDSERVKEEAEMKKREKMNEIYTQRLREKLTKEAQQKEKLERDRDLN